MALPVVLLHGFLGTSNDWKNLPEKFQRLEISSHGDFDAWLSEYRTRLPDQFVLIGYSMGGRLGLHLALAEEERCAGVIIVSAGPGLKSETERVERCVQDERWAQRFETEPIERVIEDWYAQPVFTSLSPELRQDLIARRATTDPVEAARQLRTLGSGVVPSLWYRLGEATFPILFVAGEEDAKYVAIAQRAAGLCRRGRAVIVPGAGHIVHEEAPAAFAKTVEFFLSGLERHG